MDALLGPSGAAPELGSQAALSMLPLANGVKASWPCISERMCLGEVKIATRPCRHEQNTPVPPPNRMCAALRRSTRTHACTCAVHIVHIPHHAFTRRAGPALPCRLLCSAVLCLQLGSPEVQSGFRVSSVPASAQAFALPPVGGVRAPTLLNGERHAARMRSHAHTHECMAVAVGMHARRGGLGG